MAKLKSGMVDIVVSKSKHWKHTTWIALLSEELCKFADNEETL